MANGAIREDAFAFGRRASAAGFASAADLVGSGDASETRQRSIDIYAITEHPRNREVNLLTVDFLADSIRERGLGQLPLVRKVDDGAYEHISGWHRILAYRKLYEETGDPKYAKIDCTVIRGCDDERAEGLMWDTNLCNKTLTAEERGKAWRFHDATVKRLREEEPDRYRGVPTNEVISDYMERVVGVSYSPRQIARDKAAARAEEEAASLAAARKAEQEEARKAVSEAPESPSESFSEPEGTSVLSDDFEPSQGVSELQGESSWTDGPSSWEFSGDGSDSEPEPDPEAERIAAVKAECDKIISQLSKLATRINGVRDDVDPSRARSMMRYIRSMRSDLRGKTGGDDE